MHFEIMRSREEDLAEMLHIHGLGRCRFIPPTLEPQSKLILRCWEASERTPVCTLAAIVADLCTKAVQQDMNAVHPTTIGSGTSAPY